MAAGRLWIERNLGFDPLTELPSKLGHSIRAVRRLPSPEETQREIIEFDSEAPTGREFLATSFAVGLSRYIDLPWPKGLEPRTGPKPSAAAGAPLPKADVLVVTWTVDEGHALSRVLTPGKDSRDDYVPYTHNFAAIAKKMRKGCPALNAGRLGAYWTTRIGKKSVLIFKSESHMSQDGPQVPNFDVWRQIINEVKPKLVISTGTAGGIGKNLVVGDVVVSPVVRFDCTAKFKSKPYAQASFSTVPVKSSAFAKTAKLLKVNAAQLPKDNKRLPKLFKVAPGALAKSVVTTDFFGIDTTSNYFKLKGLGMACEMGDAILGMVASEMGDKAPRWIAIRNVSDPEIDSTGLTIREQIKIAADIYKGFGRWSTVCSAIACWACIVAEG